ncbi:STAS domain-containing protein [Sinimarinibacterium thermocellulolyticum]|uniref:STAS domain-containing protein n=1 Tax=Sinimarinibacterium thermocellulolyticum TaxID=3170016 RepID=A0ABV2ABF5_9GAMM
MDDAATLALPQDLGIDQAAALKALLLPARACSVTLRIDGAGVTRLHAAGLQLIAALCRDRREAGLTTVWSQSSAPLREAASLLGLDGLLMLPTEQR